MPIENRDLIAKADLGLQELTDGGGALTPANAKQFIRTSIIDSNFMKRCTVKPMAAQKERHSRIGLSQRVLRPGTPSTQLPDGQRAKPDLGFVELDSKLFKGEVRIPDEVLEDNIESGNFQNIVMQFIPEAVSRDIDELLLQGDTASGDDYLAQLDGVLKQATAHPVDFNNSRVNFDDLSSMLRAIPKNFKKYRDKYEFLTSYNCEDDFRKLFDDRETAYGDAVLQGNEPVKFRGVPIIAVGMMPDEQGGGGNQTSILLCNPKDIVVGFWRQVRVEVDRDKREGATSFIVTLRLDVKIAVPDAVVLGSEVLNS
jgi:HK97 family phage major capsid protein